MQKIHLGQVFLKDKNVIDKILTTADVQPDETVVEIGCGEGWFSLALAKACKNLFIFEVDSHWLSETKERLAGLDHVHFTLGDVLQTRFEGVPAPFRVVANIPYHISAKIIKLLIETRDRWTTADIMVQNEFAGKLIAPPGDKNYTSFTVYCNYYLDVQSLFKVSKQSFRPVPKVDSKMIRLTPRTQRFEVEESFFRIVNAAFWGRRKTLKNCLRQSPYLDLKPGFENVPFLAENPTIRGEVLSLDDFHQLYLQLLPFFAVQ